MLSLRFSSNPDLIRQLGLVPNCKGSYVKYLMTVERKDLRNHPLNWQIKLVENNFLENHNFYKINFCHAQPLGLLQRHSAL